MDTKKLLRKEITSLLKHRFTEEQLLEESHRVAKHALELFKKKSARGDDANPAGVALFLSMPTGEMRTNELIDMIHSDTNATVYVPWLTHGQEEGETVMKFVALARDEKPERFEKDRWAIPVVPDVQSRGLGTGADLDFVFAPGLAFDPITLHRLGRGKGFYDKTLKRLERQRREAGILTPLLKYGLSLSPQVVKGVPFGEYDVSLDGIVHPDGVIERKTDSR